MSSTNKSLEKYFNENINRGTDGGNKQDLSVEDLIEWFKKMKVFDKLKVLQSDIEESFTTNNTTSNITSKDFIKILDELAEKINLESDELKNIILEQIEEREKYETMFNETLKKGQGTLGSFTEWLWSTKVFQQIQIAKSDVTEYFKNTQKNSENFTYEDFVNGMKEIAAKYNIDADELLDNIIKSQTDPGILPLHQDMEKTK